MRVRTATFLIAYSLLCGCGESKPPSASHEPVPEPTLEDRIKSASVVERRVIVRDLAARRRSAAGALSDLILDAERPAGERADAADLLVDLERSDALLTAARNLAIELPLVEGGGKNESLRRPFLHVLRTRRRSTLHYFFETSARLEEGDPRYASWAELLRWRYTSQGARALVAAWIEEYEERQARRAPDYVRHLLTELGG